VAAAEVDGVAEPCDLHNMIDQPLRNMQSMMDLIGPNMWLLLDEVSFARYFGYGSEGVAKARAFAESEGCVFIPGTGVRRQADLAAPTTRRNWVQTAQNRPWQGAYRRPWPKPT
jgi:hypothetical protein